MSNKLYVGNLSYDVVDSHLQELFASQGDVVSAQVIMDRETGRARGFGFVEMARLEDANKAIENLNGRDLLGRALKVSVAQSKDSASRGSSSAGRSSW